MAVSQATTLVDRLAERAGVELRRHKRVIEATPSQIEGVMLEMDVRADGRIADVHVHVSHRATSVRPERARRPT